MGDIISIERAKNKKSEPGTEVNATIRRNKENEERVKRARREHNEKVKRKFKSVDDLEKGMSGNWKHEGKYSMYHAVHKSNPDLITVYSNHNDHGDVGYATFYNDGQNLIPYDRGSTESAVFVDPEHRRKGLGSGMYVHAERVTGKKVIPTETQSSAGEALWADPNRPFGKSQDLEKGAASRLYPTKGGHADLSEKELAGVRGWAEYEADEKPTDSPTSAYTDSDILLDQRDSLPASDQNALNLPALKDGDSGA